MTTAILHGLTVEALVQVDPKAIVYGVTVEALIQLAPPPTFQIGTTLTLTPAARAAAAEFPAPDPPALDPDDPGEPDDALDPAVWRYSLTWPAPTLVDGVPQDWMDT